MKQIATISIQQALLIYLHLPLINSSFFSKCLRSNYNLFHYVRHGLMIIILYLKKNTLFLFVEISTTAFYELLYFLFKIGREVKALE